MATQPQLVTQRLVLEPLEACHAPILYPALRDERLFRFIPQDPPESERALQERYSRLEARQSPDGTQGWLNWAMRLAGTSTYVGTLEATVCPDATASIAYVVFTPHQGYGYATEGLRCIVEYLQVARGSRRIIALIDTRNGPSTAVVERLGFTRVETIRDADFFKGSSSDEYRFELAVGF